MKARTLRSTWILMGFTVLAYVGIPLLATSPSDTSFETASLLFNGLGDADTVRLLGGKLIGLVVVVILSVSLGTLMRSAVGTIFTILAIELIAPPILLMWAVIPFVFALFSLRRRDV